MAHRTALCVVLATTWLGCTEPDGAGPAASTSAAPRAAPPLAASTSTSAAPRARAPHPAPTLAEAVRYFREFSEEDRYFFSDNYVSNETSTLHVARTLDARARRGGAYLGVGPEQNYSYIALLEPQLAFIVDVRRANALQHWLFKALFETSADRAELLCRLLGRGAPPQPGDAGATLKELLTRVDGCTKSEATFDAVHGELVERVRGFGVTLDAKDIKSLRAAQRAFFDGGLDTRFSLHEENGRTYPPLRTLLALEDDQGVQRGFLATDEAFRTIKRLHAEHRIIPIVGDFAGGHALHRIGALLRSRDLPVSAFYVSNVEQYLLEPTKWRAWTTNVDSLPTNEQSVFIRCYLDQGKKHPRQKAGHRTTTVVSSVDDFRWRQRKSPAKSFMELVTQGLLD